MLKNDGQKPFGFQPHRYSRTNALFQEFLSAFHEADLLLVFDVYPAGEEPIPGASGERLSEAIRDHGHKATFYAGKATEAAADVVPRLRPGDIFLIMGAGDVWKLADVVVSR